jgi:hypothetical protein
MDYRRAGALLLPAGGFRAAVSATVKPDQLSDTLAGLSPRLRCAFPGNFNALSINPAMIIG